MNITSVTHMAPPQISEKSDKGKNSSAVRVESQKPKIEAKKLNDEMSRLQKRIERAVQEATKNTRYSYSINQEIDQFIVKIIDSDTDKVIKVIPSEEVQKLHENIQEAIGLLFDEEV